MSLRENIFSNAYLDFEINSYTATGASESMYASIKPDNVYETWWLWRLFVSSNVTISVTIEIVSGSETAVLQTISLNSNSIEVDLSKGAIPFPIDNETYIRAIATSTAAGDVIKIKAVISRQWK